MKKLLPLLLVFFLTKCAQQNSTPKLSMPGVYSLKHQTVTISGRDSMVDKRQLKIYTDKYMMYASPSSSDSLANYGIATYNVDGEKVTEEVFYTSANGSTKDTFVLKVDKNEDGYKQVIENTDANNKRNPNYTSTEIYEKVGMGDSSALDGVWKQTTRLNISKEGDTSVDDVQTQFKIYQNGFFIWANTYEDTVSHKFPSAFGYGTFTMSGDSATEVNINSTYAVSLISKPFVIKVDFTGKSEYKQTHLYPLGNRSVEIYQRLP
jgi:hypothetical protein